MQNHASDSWLQPPRSPAGNRRSLPSLPVGRRTVLRMWRHLSHVNPAACNGCVLHRFAPVAAGAGAVVVQAVVLGQAGWGVEQVVGTVEAAGWAAAVLVAGHAVEVVVTVLADSQPAHVLVAGHVVAVWLELSLQKSHDWH